MDRREEILARLLVVAQGMSGITTAVRNGSGLSENKMPAIVILDADDQAQGAADGRGRGPQMVTVTPEIYILLAGDSDDIGSQINGFRAALIKAVLADGNLNTLTGPNGAITYDGCATGLARGRSMQGEMGVSLSFTYPLIPNEL